MGDTLTQATTSPPPKAQVRWMSITHATVSGTAQENRLGRHSNPGYSVPPNSPAKTDSLTQASVFPPTHTPNSRAKADTIAQATVVTPNSPTMVDSVVPRLQSGPQQSCNGEHSKSGHSFHLSRVQLRGTL